MTTPRWVEPPALTDEQLEQLEQDEFTLTVAEVRDVRALLAWAFSTKPGIPMTENLNRVWSKANTFIQDRT